ncbi:MAG: hypothetical protein O2971_08530 [Proteobacteria bacterium]|nr:hypothetical protein [Pseudomonadota bacterium]
MSYREDFENAGKRSQYAATELLWHWLQSDEHRPRLFHEFRTDKKPPFLKFQSMASKGEDENKVFKQEVVILFDPEDIKQALQDQNFSNDPYKPLGSGTSVLASDDEEPQNHEVKREVLASAFKNKDLRPFLFLDSVTALACHHGIVLARKKKEFNFVSDVAEQSALIFASGLFGIPTRHHYLMQELLRKSLDAMAYQMFSRHFTNDALALQTGNIAMGGLAKVIDELLQEAACPPYFDELQQILWRGLGSEDEEVKQERIAAVKKVLDVVPAVDIDKLLGLKEAKLKGHPQAEELEAMYAAHLRELDKLKEKTADEREIVRDILKYFDEALNYHEVREWAKDRLTINSLELEENEFNKDLLSIFRLMREDKERAEDDLIRKKLDPFDDGNFIYRKTIIEVLAENPGNHSGNELIVDIVAAIAGTVGNITAGASIALNEILHDKGGSREAINIVRGIMEAALEEGAEEEKDKDKDKAKPLPRLPHRLPVGQRERGQFFGQAKKRSAEIANYVKEALRLYPPAPFVPRLAKNTITLAKNERKSTKVEIAAKQVELLPLGSLTRGSTQTETESFKVEIAAKQVVLLPLGSLTRGSTQTETESFNAKRDKRNLDESHNYLFGYPEHGSEHTHRCLGDYISIPLISNIVANVLLLDGIDLVDPETTESRKDIADLIAPTLKKKWGFICESLDLSQQLSAQINQSPLNVIMKVRTPVGSHAEVLKRIIQYGAPTIQYLLESSNMVHFARFVFLNNDTELGLFTSYDGEFDPYIRHFANAAGPLFDQIFAHIQDPPLMPVRENPSAFIEHIKRYDRSPVSDYFYTSYPEKTVTEILGKASK